MLWDDYFGFDWYLFGQMMLWGGLILSFMGLVGLTEGWGFFWMFASLGVFVSNNTDSVLIICILLAMALYQFVRYKGGY